MVDGELSNALRDLPNKVLNASIEERTNIFRNVTSVLSHPGINSTIVRGLCKVIGTTLTKYKDASSQQLVRNLIKNLIIEHHDLTIEHLSSVLKCLLTKDLALTSNQKHQKAAVIALGWTLIVMKESNPNSNVFKSEFPKLIECQTILYQIILTTLQHRFIEAAEKILFEQWQTTNILQDSILILVEKESKIANVVMLMLMLRFQNDSNIKIEVSYKETLINNFVKTMVTSKTKPLDIYLISCKPLLEVITQAEFEDYIYPKLQKAMLRSPEIVLQAVGFILENINLESNAYAEEIGKILIQYLYYKDEIARSDSVESLKKLAKKCSSVQIIEKLLQQIFSILNGSDGKISVLEYRINLILGAGNLSFNNIPEGSMNNLLETVVSLFSKSLEIEIQEKVICHVLDMFGLWTMKFHGQLPDKVIHIFQKGLNLKNTTQVIRLSYLQWLLLSLSSTQMSENTKIVESLMKLYEKAMQNQTLLQLSEAVCIACILLKVEKPSEKYNTFWNSLLDLNKISFFNEKFIAIASPETLCHITFLAEQLLTTHFKKLKGAPDALFRLIVCNLASNATSVRKCAITTLENITNATQGIEFIQKFIQELEHQIDFFKIQYDTGVNNDESGTPSSIFVEALNALCNTQNVSCSDVQTLAMQLILISNHPAIVYNDPNLWESILTKNFNINAKKFVSENVESITAMCIMNFQSTKTFENTISMLVKINPDIIMPRIISNVLLHLNDSNLISITDDEYFIFLTPEGEVYDKSVLPNSENLQNTSRLKRENKAYSFKDQLEELQLRREIEEKRKKEGKSKPQKLTQKQQEIINNQVEKENRIKLKLNEINDKLMSVVSMLDAATIGNVDYLSIYFYTLLDPVLNGMSSALAAKPLSNLYFTLRTCVKLPHNLDYLISIATIRLQQPHCNLKSEWESMDINSTIENIFSILEKMLLQPEKGVNETDFSKKILNSASFTYVFEFIKRALKSELIQNKEEHFLLGIQFIETHAQMRSKPAHDEFLEHHNPKYMPTLAIFKLLMDLIQKFRGRIQTQAASAVLEVAKMTSGSELCSMAGREEILLLLNALQSNLEAIRDVALRALNEVLQAIISKCRNDVDLKSRITVRLWIAQYDLVEDIRILASQLWKNTELLAPSFEDLIPDIIHPELCIQKAASSSLVPLLAHESCLNKQIIKKLLSIYSDKLIMIPPKLDQFDREVEPAIDQWKPRRGVAIAISQIAQYFTIEDVNHIMQFMVSLGLGDRDEIVHKEMLGAALIIVDIHGKEAIITLIPVFENFLDKAPNSKSYDNIRQAVVILMGTLARHLEKNDKRIEPIVRRLISALSTPSQQVQQAVANCLPHLMPSVKEEAPSMVKKLLHLLVKSEKYGERRGAAYGIAGIVKGLGILSLKQLDIMSKLTMYIQEKKNYKSREGALFAFEVLCTTLGRLFEPYIVHVLPHLLQCFGDSSQYVRQAADDTAKVVMGKLSAHGVKLVLPSLLDALDEDSWRTKTASVELLGAMAFCAPKQLSSCLPSIVPKLIEVLGDSHAKVQEAGADALKLIGSVIKNPEIQAIVPILLKALEDPSNNTSICLQSLLKTKFVHFIDAPSLALIMPVVQRAFMDRSTETRKMAAQIIGNMYSLTDQKDLTPYLPSIIPGLKSSLLDPVPEVRAVSARALGAMVKGMGEASFEDLLPWLMQTLTSESSSVDRSGAAQGLSEVVGGLGVAKMHKLMPEIIATAERNDIAPHVKDGYIMMFIYMPGAFPQEFTPYIGQIITPILKALADENEYVRDTALKAGQRIVNLYAESAVTLLLPELENGLFDDNWRIRLSSVQLLGDLLYRISGVSGKMTTETASEDDNFGTEQSHAAIIRFLGDERRNRVLSGLYMGRSDVSLMVRQSALHVWKVVVTNTPRTLREILPTLFGLLLGCLASTSYDKRQVAARTLGDLVRKLGERVLPEIIPILESGLNSEQPDQRQGVCIGLSEIMASTSKEMVLSFVNSLVPTVRKALSDPLPEVREAAAKTFDSLHSTVGSRALDDILPSMLEGLSDTDSVYADNTLDGLRQVMLIKSKVVLPYLVPQLTAPPVNTKALSILVSVAGEALTKYLPKILAALLDALSEAHGSSNEQLELEYCQTVILSVTDEIGIRTIMDTLMISAKSENVIIRRSSSSLLSAFCMHSPGDYSQYVPQLLRCLLRLMADKDKDILLSSWDALNAVIKCLDSAKQIAHVSDVRQAVRFAASDLKESELPGFCLPKGISPLLPVFREAILNGLPDEKENAAQGLGEIISLTSAQSLQPSVVHITGPLIRILGDRFNAGVKAAVLETLAILLNKVGIMLKQFLPQLQTTFLKALHDQNRNVRMKAGLALSELVIIHSRADPLFNEIHNGIKTADDSALRETMLQALRSILSPSGGKMSETSKKQICCTLLSMISHQEDLTRGAVGGCLGVLIKYLQPEQVKELLNNQIIAQDNEDYLTKHGRSVVLFVALKECPNVILTDSFNEKIINNILASISSEKVPIACNGIRAATYLLVYNLMNNKNTPNNLIVAFTRAMNHSSNDVKQLVAKSCAHLAKTLNSDQITSDVMKYLIPMLVNGTKEKNGYVKSNAELSLVSILRLRSDDSTYLKTCEILESGAKDSLTDVVSKVLKKVTLQTPGKDEELDDTLLT